MVCNWYGRIASWTPAKTLILERISSRNPTVIAENYFSFTCVSGVFADARLKTKIFTNDFIWIWSEGSAERLLL